MSSRTAIALSLSLLTSAIHAAPTATTTTTKPAATQKVTTTTTKDTVLVNKDAQVVKVGCVNTYDAMQLSATGKQEAVRIEKVRKDLTDTIQKKEQKLTQAMTDFKAKQSTLAVAAREKEESRIMEMRRDLESTVQGSEDQLKLAMQRATEKLSKEIEDAVTQIAQKQGLDLVTDVYTGRPIYASDKMLLTKDLISTMDVNTAKVKSESKTA